MAHGLWFNPERAGYMHSQRPDSCPLDTTPHATPRSVLMRAGGNPSGGGRSGRAWPALVLLLASAPSAVSLSPPTVVIVGGTGRIGSAVASHVILRTKQGAKVGGARVVPRIVLAGRDDERGAAARKEVLAEHDDASADSSSSLEFLKLDWRDHEALRRAIRGADAVVHTAGPYAGEEPDVLVAAAADADADADAPSSTR